jgi:hypothetical protein
MEKIPTIFERDFSNGGRIKSVYVQEVVGFPFSESKPTEKVDGMNVRLTVRNHVLVRLEKRHNPSKEQKAVGIVEPWYVDALESDSADQHLWSAAKNTSLVDVPDGSWSGEAIGVSIQGNPLKLPTNMVLLFSLGRAPVFTDVPCDFEGLREWLPKQRSQLNPECGIEGIVWHAPDGRMAKIKVKDFARVKDGIQ